jgi:hypothetical protein
MKIPDMRIDPRKFFALALAAAAMLALTGCPSGSKMTKTLDLTLLQYEKAVRWSEWEVAANHLAPAYLDANPITRLDMDRLRLFRVTQYIVRSTTPFDAGMGLSQVVEIRMFNRSRAVERSYIDQQEWRYDADTERWFLHSGLPDVTRLR